MLKFVYDTTRIRDRIVEDNSWKVMLFATFLPSLAS